MTTKNGDGDNIVSPLDAAINDTLGNTNVTTENNEGEGGTGSSTGTSAATSTPGASNANGGTGDGTPVDRTLQQQSSAATKAGTKQPAQTQQQQTQQGAARPGDLVGTDGNVIARAGAERRFYETAQRATNELRTLNGRVAPLEAEVRAFREANTAMAQLGLQPQESTTAMQLFANYKKNPLETLRYMLTEAKAAGIDIEKLNVGGSIDTAAITRLLDTRLAPFTQHADAQRQTQEALTQAGDTWNNFTARYTEAATHEDAMVALMERDPNLTLHDAYFSLRQWAMDNQLDFTQPLQPQYAARLQSGNGQQQQQSPAQSRGLPQGRGGAGPQNLVEMKTGALASEHLSSGDIVRQALAEQGITV